MADDLGNADVGYHGGQVKTPNIDKLAAEASVLNHSTVCPFALRPVRN